MARHCPNSYCPGLARDGTAPEFVDSIERCTDCGGRLMRGPSPDDPPETPRPEPLRTVFIAADAVQAHLVRGAIEADEIYVFLKGEALVSAIGELPVNVRQVEVQVAESDFDRARGIALRFEGARDSRDRSSAQSSED